MQMKGLLLAVTISAFVAGNAFAQTEPEMDPALVAEQTSSSSSGLIIPMILLLLIVAVTSGGSSYSPPR